VKQNILSREHFLPLAKLSKRFLIVLATLVKANEKHLGNEL
jgi:hypothetical protein